MIPIVFIFLFYAQLLKEILTKIIKLIWNDLTRKNQNSNLRYGVLINLLIAVYSNYYGIWSVINYLNDKDYRMLKSQIFFSVTELIPSFIYFKCLNRFDLVTNKYQPITLSIIYPILSISCLHIYLGVLERLLWGFLTSNFADATRNKARDILLITGDNFGIIFSIVYMVKIKKQSLNFKNNSNDESHFYYFKYWLIICFLAYKFYVMFCSF